MSTLEELREKNQRKRRRWIIALAVGVPVVIYCVLLALTHTDKYEQIPDSVWASQDPRAIAQALKNPPSTSITDSAAGGVLPPGSNVKHSGPIPSTPASVKQAADKWVRAINNANPNAILYHEAGPYGNLYIAVGAWWGALSPDQQVQALDNLGRYWRSYLYDAFGYWRPDSSTTGSPTGSNGQRKQTKFAPGIVIVDSKGKVAQNLNGQVIIHRQISY